MSRFLRRSSAEERTTSTGIVCDSKYEKQCIQSLIDRGIKFSYHPETREYSSRVRMAWCADCESRNVRQGRKYTTDVELHPSRVWVECKGKFPPKERNLMDQFLKQTTETVRFAFQRDNRLTKGKPKRYSDWCREREIEFVIGTEIPAEWSKS